jgi:hypothetical protein
LVLVVIAIFMLGVMPSVYAHTQDYLKGYNIPLKKVHVGDIDVALMKVGLTLL